MEKKLNKEFSKKFSEWIVFKFHDISSKHSQDWFLSLYWIVIISFLYSHFKVLLCQEKLEYYIIPFLLNTNIFIFMILKINLVKTINIYYIISSFTFIYVIYGFRTDDFTLLNFANNLNPFSIMTGYDTLNFSTLIYKIIIAYLIYQFVISIRQNTRRK